MRNQTITLTGDALDRQAHYAEAIMSLRDCAASFTFTVESRSTGEVSTVTGTLLEVVGTPGLSTYGVKVDTERGPRTYNFHLMGA